MFEQGTVGRRIALVLGLLAITAAATVATAQDAGDKSVQLGTAITPDMARSIYDRVAPLRSPDGCRLSRFDTIRFSINIGLEGPSGTSHTLALLTSAQGSSDEIVAGGWFATPSEALASECAESVAAIRQILEETAPPSGAPWRQDRWAAVRANYTILAVAFLVLVGWSLLLLYRAWVESRPPPAAIVTLAALTLLALVLRLALSPHTFLHEYYHIAEALYGHLRGETGPVYGDTGPALYQAAAYLWGRPDDASVIFLTNAIMASLAIPAAALLDLAIVGSWPRAICAAALLCVLPHHLRFSASEVLFIPAVTLGLWSLALCALYARTQQLSHALCAVIALCLAMQTRPEMMFFPAIAAFLVLLAAPRAWRIFFTWRSLLALVVLVVLLTPRWFELRQVMNSDNGAQTALPDLQRYTNALVLLDPNITPQSYLYLIGIGLIAGIRVNFGYALWCVLTFGIYTLFSLSLFDNPPYNVRSQLLPTAFTIFLAAGVASIWMGLWQQRRVAASITGGVLLSVLCIHTLLGSKAWITELADQQLEWAFLERTVPTLPPQATLLAVTEVGGRSLDAFPELLLRRADKDYRLVDLRQAIEGNSEWPKAGPGSLFYQGMFCYFAFPTEPSPNPMTEMCAAVHRRYTLEALHITDLDTKGYSAMSYADGPYRIGFYRLLPR